MLSIKNKDGVLLVGDFSDALTLIEIQSGYDGFCKALASPPPAKIIFDLASVKKTDYSVLTFIIACAETASKKKIGISFSNLSDDDLKTELLRIGFDCKGSYNPKEFRKDSPKSLFMSAGTAVCNFCEDTKKLFGFIGEIISSVFYLIRNPRKLDLGETLFYIDKSGADGVPIVMLICFLMGLILAFQGLTQMMKFGLQIYIADLVGLAIIRELGPLMVAMICIGRAGSAYAAELGTMKVSEEIDAMETMGLKPARFLVIPKMIALILSVPMLVLIGDLCGIIGGVLITISMSDISYVEYMNRTLQSLVPWNIVESLIKAIVFAFIVAGVGCFRGFEAERDAKGVGSATTSSVVSGIFLVIVADFFVTFFYPQILASFGISY